LSKTAQAIATVNGPALWRVRPSKEKVEDYLCPGGCVQNDDVGCTQSMRGARKPL